MGQPTRVYFWLNYYGELEDALDSSLYIFKMLNINVMHFAKKPLSWTFSGLLKLFSRVKTYLLMDININGTFY